MSKIKITLLITGGIGIFFFGCLLTCLAFWIFSGPRPAAPLEALTPEQVQAYRVEIEKIAPQMKRLTAETFGKEAGKTPAERQADFAPLVKTLDDGLFKIDVSNCPPDFQAAYLELIRSLEKARAYAEVNNGGIDSVLAMASDGVWATVANFGKNSQECQEIKKKLNDAESELRLTAKKYNANGF